jgi:BMFP domain-containing protein YqiC
MSIAQTIDEISRKIEAALPEGMRTMKDDAERSVRTIVQNAFQKMELVTREEFDVQTQVLARTRARLEALEARVAELEARDADRAHGD